VHCDPSTCNELTSGGELETMIGSNLRWGTIEEAPDAIEVHPDSA
jgi:hypothetical protein